jgi:predicted RNA-binding Zn ribbon-like protein
MSNEIVSDAEVEKALDWLRDNADAIGEAKRAAVKYDHMLKHTKAVVMKSHAELPVSAQEREAMASDAFYSAIENAANTAAEYEKMKALREAAALKIEVWRSASANYRAMKI